jgi:glycosyltransferase involved in cell wall biosynthesis
VQRRVPSAPRTRTNVTAVITAYNYGRYLSACGRSALTQDGVDAALVIVDDCSTDETSLVAAELARDPRVTVIRNESNLGLIGSFNRGLERVESEYVVKLDADDLLPAGAWARATAFMEEHPRAAFVYGRPYNFKGPVPNVATTRPRSWSIWRGRDWVASRCRSGANVISQPEVVVRTEALRAVGGLCEESPVQTSDMNLWIQLASIGDVGRINGPVQGLYRVHEASMLRTTHAGGLCDLEGRRGAFDAAFAAAAGSLPGASDLHELARERLAAIALDGACRAYDRGRTSEWSVDDFVAFALETCPEARELKEWAALERRRAVGAARAQRHPRFLTAAVARRTAEEIGRWLWLRTGEY